MRVPPPLPFTDAPSYGGGGFGHATTIIRDILLAIIRDILLAISALYGVHKMYDYYFGEGRQRRLERMRKRNEKIAKAIEKLKEAEEITRLVETTKKIEEAIVESGLSLSEDGDTND